MFIITATVTINTAVSKQEAKRRFKEMVKTASDNCIISVSEFPDLPDEPIVYPEKWYEPQHYGGRPI